MSLSRFFPVMVEILCLLLFQSYNTLLPPASATPAPMNSGDPRWSYNYNQGYDGYDFPIEDPIQYGHPDQNPNQYGNNPGQVGQPALQINLPGSHLFQEEAPVETPRSTPRTQALTNAVRKASRFRGHGSSQGVPESPRNLPQQSISNFNEPSNYPQDKTRLLSSFHDQRGIGVSSSSFGNYNQANTFQQEGGSSSNHPTQPELFGGVPQYLGNMQAGQEMTNHFNTVNTDFHHPPVPKSKPGKQKDRPREHELLPNRKRIRLLWEKNNLEGPIPLCLLTDHECRAIGVTRHTPRYQISLYLENRYLRSKNIHIGPVIPEPAGWRDPNGFDLAIKKDYDFKKWNPRLKQTQGFLDHIFDLYEVFSTPEQKKEARLAQLAARRRGGGRPSEEDPVAMEQWYYKWTNEHDNYLVPLRYMSTGDCGSMGLAKGGIKYQVAKYVEEQEFVALDRRDLCSTKLTQKPDIKKFLHRLTSRHRVPQNSYIEAKQSQLQALLIKYGYM